MQFDIPTHFSCGPASKPTLQVHSKLPTVFIHVPFPQTSFSWHSFLSEILKHLYLAM